MFGPFFPATLQKSQTLLRSEGCETFSTDHNKAGGLQPISASNRNACTSLDFVVNNSTKKTRSGLIWEQVNSTDVTQQPSSCEAMVTDWHTSGTNEQDLLVRWSRRTSPDIILNHSCPVKAWRDINGEPFGFKDFFKSHPRPRIQLLCLWLQQNWDV